MTLNELLAETYALGFEDAGRLDPAFAFAASRALRLITSEHGYEKCSKIFIPSLDISYHERELHGSQSKTVKFVARGTAYSFRAYGTGTFFVKDGTVTRAFTFSTADSPFRGKIINGEAEFTFFSGTAFTLIDFAAFASVYSEEDIPLYAELRSYNLGEQIPDFSYATRPPTTPDGKELEGAYISGEELKLPATLCGELSIYYKSIPRALTVDDGEKDIDIPKKCLHLLPILTAAYIWLDDDEQKAAYYMQIYNDESQRLRRGTPKLIDSKYTDTAGWA